MRLLIQCQFLRVIDRTDCLEEKATDLFRVGFISSCFNDHNGIFGTIGHRHSNYELCFYSRVTTSLFWGRTS